MPAILFDIAVILIVLLQVYLITMQGNTLTYQYEYLKKQLLKEKSGRYRSGYLLPTEEKFLTLYQNTPTSPVDQAYLHQAYHAAHTLYHQRRKPNRTLRGH
jgi:hypothetical protein